MRYYNIQQLVAETSDKITLIIHNNKNNNHLCKKFYLAEKCQSIVDTILQNWFPNKNNTLIRLTYDTNFTCWKTHKKINSIVLNKRLKDYDFDEFQKIYSFIEN